MGDGSGSRPGSRGKGRPAQNSDVLAMDLDAAEGGVAAQGGSGAFSQMQLVEQQVCNVLFTRIIHQSTNRIHTFNRGQQPSSPSSQQ